MTGLTSSPVPPAGPSDHVRGHGEDLIIYVDLACPHCSAEWGQLVEFPGRLVFRHFPVASAHPRATALHAAAEAAGNQGKFFEMVDSLLADRGHVDDPHLWRRAEALELDHDAFEADRRSEVVADRVRRDFESGIRGGVTGTPARFGPAAEIGPAHSDL